MNYDKKLTSNLKDFIQSDFYLRDYNNYETFFGDVVLTRVFRFEPPDLGASALIGLDGKKIIDESKRRIITYGKVMALGDKCSIDLKVGDLVALSDNLIAIQDNPAFMQYLIETNGEKAGGIEAARPSQTINSFTTYRATYGFLGDKVKEGGADPDDFFTFLFPTNFIKAKIDKKKMTSWLDSL